MDIRIPNLGEGAESGSVVSVLVKEGDRIAKDQTILELENEKAVAPIPSPAAGTITKIHVKAGDKVTVGQVIATLEEGAVPPLVSPRPKETSGESPAPRLATGPGEYHYESKSGVSPPAAPSVRKLANDLGIDLTRVKGSESGGRITLADLKAYVTWLQGRTSKAAPAVSVDFSKWGPVTRKPMSSLRQTIGQRMTESWTSVPHVTQFDEADITKLMALRKKLSPSYEKKGIKLTVTPFLIRAVVAALKKYPRFNSSLDERSHELVLKNYFHIGVAVDTEAGLIVPVLRDADKKNLEQIAKELDALAEKTRQRKISADELKGGSFTVSNLGGIGGGHFTPIVNKPEVAILGVGRAKKSGDSLLLPLALSYDHRVIDGADGARFIRALAEAIENP